MKQLTVRGVEDDLHEILKFEAKRKGLSLNQYVLSLLKQAGDFIQNKLQNREVFDDLDHLAGTWSQEEANEFDSELKKQRQIDGGLW